MKESVVRATIHELLYSGLLANVAHPKPRCLRIEMLDVVTSYLQCGDDGGEKRCLLSMSAKVERVCCRIMNEMSGGRDRSRKPSPNATKSKFIPITEPSTFSQLLLFFYFFILSRRCRSHNFHFIIWRRFGEKPKSRTE